MRKAWLGWWGLVLATAAGVPGQPDGSVFWSGSSAGFEVRWTPEDLVAAPAGQPSVYSAKAVALRDFVRRGEDDERTCDVERRFIALSLVGSLLSVQDTFYSFCEQPYPELNEVWRVVDLTSPERRLKLTDFFPEADVYAALLRDSYVQRALASVGATRPASLGELIEVLAPTACRFGFEEDLLERFAFHHVEGTRVAVRLGVSDTDSLPECLRNVTQIGLLLSIPPALEPALGLALSGKEGFLSRQKVGGKGKTVIGLPSASKLLGTYQTNSPAEGKTDCLEIDSPQPNHFTFALQAHDAEGRECTLQGPVEVFGDRLRFRPKGQVCELNLQHTRQPVDGWSVQDPAGKCAQRLCKGLTLEGLTWPLDGKTEAFGVCSPSP